MKKMTARLSSLLVACTLMLVVASCGKKDSEILADVQKQTTGLNIQGFNATVTDGVVTLTGTSLDDASKAAAESAVKGLKGVKSVVNNITIAAPPPVPVAPVEIAVDDPLSKGVTDAVKDYPSVKATVQDGVITLTGEIQRKNLQKLIMTLNTLKPKKIENKLTIN